MAGPTFPLPPPWQQPDSVSEPPAPQPQSVALPAQSDQVDTGYWDWCESQFDMSGFRSTSSGFLPSRAKCARDSLLAQVDVALRGEEKIFHPQVLMYATRADMRALVSSLPKEIRKPL